MNILEKRRHMIIDSIELTIEKLSEGVIDISVVITDIDKFESEFQEVQRDIEKTLVKMKCDEETENKILDRSGIASREFRGKIIELKAFIPKTTKIEEKKSQQVKLPKIELPLFDGSYCNYRSFIELYDVLVHDNASLSDIERFQYLKTSLRGEPLALIKALPLTETNYSVARKLLREKYNNERLIAATHVNAILDLPSLNLEQGENLKGIITIFKENYAAIEAMKFPIAEWDFLLFIILFNKLSTETKRMFEINLNTTRIPRVSQLMEFLENRVRAEECIFQGKSHTKKRNHRSSFVVQAKGKSNENTCAYCDGAHMLENCFRFKKITTPKRYAFVKDKHLCFNCLERDHTVAACPANVNCDQCNRRHHSVLHYVKDNRKENSNSRGNSPPHATVVAAAEGTAVSLTTSVSSCPATVLLSTAIIHVRDAIGNYQLCRILVDSGAQLSFITERCAQRLKLPRRSSEIQVYGLGQAQAGRTRGSVSCVIKPLNSTTPSFCIEAFVIREISGNLPLNSIVREKWPHLEGLSLADPSYWKSAPVDMLLGADWFSSILLDGRISGPSQTPSAVKSVFGWMLMGQVRSSQQILSAFHLSVEDSTLNNALKRFWELEEIKGCTKLLSPEESRCEAFFEENHYRNESGRYVVSLPFKTDNIDFGNTYEPALRRYLALERRLRKQPLLKQAYSEVMEDYLRSGHMDIVKEGDNSPNAYFLPHHCVVKESSLTTRIRVVFDANSKGSLGTSLNDVLLVGPKLQPSILHILMRFRLHDIAFTADLKQMYRQILVTPSHYKFQCILWRREDELPIEIYRLKTVTFGLSSSPFLAIRVIHQLANDEQEDFSLASKALINDTYVDDVISGASDVTSALELQKELIQMLERGGFEIRKWCSNHPALFQSVDQSDTLISVDLDFDNDFNIKVLGLIWKPKLDIFSYLVKPVSKVTTKRIILSEISKIFDPVGWLSPVTLYAKTIIQRLWTQGLSWDEAPSVEIIRDWEGFRDELILLENIKIPRNIFSSNAQCEIHGFCDSSEIGFGAVVYLKVIESNRISLILAKAKVAPLKKISIPRLELCGAHLLSRLINQTQLLYEGSVKISRIYAWSDSTVALAWIKSSPHRWKTFVANRVTEIQENVSPECWCHVKSEDNPADCASRGILPSQLISHHLWWNGPTWLKMDSIQWCQNLEPTLDSELEKREITSKSFKITLDDDILGRFSSLSKLLRITTLCFRFGRKCKGAIVPDYITIPELNEALVYWIKYTQESEFYNDYPLLRQGKECSVRLQRLKPFIDDLGIIRVGGRLHNSNLSYERKHPILLPKDSYLSKLIIDEAHIMYLHLGPQALQHILSLKYWILSARDIIRQRIFKCITCFRSKAKPIEPIMADLPAHRLQQIRPFLKVGVDFGGPFLIKEKKLRNVKTLKCYLCIFICCATKAVHLELVSDLSTSAFIATLKRFVSRRGICSDIYSDCGTNFVGANREIKDVYRWIKENGTQLQRICTDQTITWHFNPPAAPHFGGLWEAGVKSVKGHLTKVIGNQKLTYEELGTLLAQIEAILNSRPLCPLTADPCELSALTPGHFLIGEPMVAVPEPSLIDLNVGRLSRWQLVQHMFQNVWKRWHLEYLHQLQQRLKWCKLGRTVQLNDLVILRDDNVPPLQWRLGRVVELHPGKDQVLRVVSVKTQTGVVKRPLIKVCPLPITD